MEQDQTLEGDQTLTFHRDDSVPDTFSQLWTDLIEILDGSLGNIDDLALQYTEYYGTCFGDVCERMEELRKRSLSHDQDTGKTDVTPTSAQRHVELQESLGFSSAVTTPEMERKPPLHKSSSEDGAGGRWEGKKKNKSFWQNFKKSPKGLRRQSSKGEDIGYLASEITMSDEERIQLMMMVKERMITVEEALARLKEFETQTRQSSNTDRASSTDGSSPSAKDPTNFNSRELSDEELEDCVKFRRLHKLVNPGRRARKNFVKVDDSKKPGLEEGLSYEASLMCDSGLALYSGVVKVSTKLSSNSPSPSSGLSTSPSSSSLDTWSGRPGPTPGRACSIQGLICPSSRDMGDHSGGWANSGSPPFPGPGACRREQGKVSRSLTDGEMQKSHASSAHGRTCSFGGFDLSNRSLHVVHSRDASKERDGVAKEGLKSPATPRLSLGKKVKSVKDTVKKCMSKKVSGSVSEESSPEGTASSPQSPQLSTNSMEKVKLKAGGSVESLRSSLSGQSSMSGQTVSTTDSSASNRESVKSEDGEEEELPYRGPFCGRARVHTDFTPSPYDTDSLKLKRGDIIDIISKPPMGTWMGLLNNKVGTFKFIYVDVLGDEAKKPRRSVKRRRKKGRPPKPASVEELLQRISLKEHMATFLFNGYEDLDTFKLLEEEDLDELNIHDPQHRAVLLTAIELLRDYDDSHSDPDDGGQTKEQLLTDREDPHGTSPRDSGCYASSEHLETGKSRKSSFPSRSLVGFRSDHRAPVPVIDGTEAMLQTKRERCVTRVPCTKGFVEGHRCAQRSCYPLGVNISRSCEELHRPLCAKGLWERSFSLEQLNLMKGFDRRDIKNSGPKPAPVLCSGIEAGTELSSKPRSFCPAVEHYVVEGTLISQSGRFEQPSKRPLSLPLCRPLNMPEVAPSVAVMRTYPKKPPVPPPVPHKKEQLAGGLRHLASAARSPGPPPRPAKPIKMDGPMNEQGEPPAAPPPWLSDLPQSGRLAARKSWHMRAADLESLLEEQLEREGIDLTEEPYSDKHGRCGIPHSLVQRYAEDFGQPVKDAMSSMDQIRVRQLHRQHRMAIPLGGQTELCRKAPSPGRISTVADWLVLVGLPMYSDGFTAAGYATLGQITSLTDSDLLGAGVRDKRHVRLLLSAARLLQQPPALP